MLAPEIINTLQKPTASEARTASGSVGAAAKARVDRQSGTGPHRGTRGPRSSARHDQGAEHGSEAEGGEQHVNVDAVPWKLRSASNGSVTG